MGYLICGKCKGYYRLQSGESVKDFIDNCDCGGKLRYVENLDIIDPNWKQISIKKKITIRKKLQNKVQSLRTIPVYIKNRLTDFYYNIGERIHSNQRRVHRTPYGMETDLINSIISVFNFSNIRWILIIPVAIAISIIFIVQGIFTLIIFILLAVVGYLFDNRIIGTKNAIVTGTISFFIGSLLTGSYLYIIPYILLGILNGAVCGWIGGYIKTKKYA